MQNSTSTPNYCDEPYCYLGMYVNNVLSAWTEVWSGSYRARAPIMAPEGRFGQISMIFEILGGAGDINNSISMPNYCDGPYIPFLLCTNKVLSAWTEVWSGAWPSRASIMAPGGRDLVDF